MEGVWQQAWVQAQEQRGVQAGDGRSAEADDNHSRLAGGDSCS